MEDYRTIRGTAIGEYEEKKSRFIAQLSFADSEEAAVAFLEKVRAENRTARHNVYAYRLREGNRERYSDDGEPAKTAGTPALEVLQHSGLPQIPIPPSILVSSRTPICLSSILVLNTAAKSLTSSLKSILPSAVK